jgi:Uncharacterized conserved protein (COG2071)
MSKTNEHRGNVPTPWADGRLGRIGRGPRLLFGATYEDPNLEIAAFAGCREVLCIAGAGDLARSLAAVGFRVTALDVNPRQIEYAIVRSNGGPFRRGSAEHVMGIGRNLLRLGGWSAETMRRLAVSDDPVERETIWKSLTSGHRGLLLRMLLSPARLAVLFRPEFVSLAGPGFYRRLVETVGSSLQASPSEENPFAHLLFAGKPFGSASRDLGGTRFAENPKFVCADILQHLEGLPEGSVECAAMSNICDGAPADFRAKLDSALRRALKPGAPVTVRTLGDVSALSTTIQLGSLANDSTALADAQRSSRARRLGATDRSLIWSGFEVQHNSRPESTDANDVSFGDGTVVSTRVNLGKSRKLHAQLQRHPFSIATTLNDSLVLLYAVDAAVLERFVPPGLELERVGAFGLVALATVRASKVRPRGFPSRLGSDFMLTGYRVVVRFRAPDGSIRRALRILQSDTDSALMAFGGNLFTEYGYRRRKISTEHRGANYFVRIESRQGIELDMSADVSSDDKLPAGSPFGSTREARRYTGPLPWTVGYIADLDSFVAVRGRRDSWKPRLVDVDVRTCTFFDSPMFDGYKPVLAAAFYLDGVPYSWDRGLRMTPAQVRVGATPEGTSSSSATQELREDNYE